jgi:hypothetical protein
MTKMVPKCIAPSQSEGVCVVGFSDGSVSLWSSESLKISLQREEKRQAEEEKQAFETQGKRAFASPAGDAVGSLVTVVGDPLLLPRADLESGSEADKECVDSLPFMAKWDLKTGLICSSGLSKRIMTAHHRHQCFRICELTSS